MTELNRRLTAGATNVAEVTFLKSGAHRYLYGMAAGDVILLCAFAFIGRWSHHELSVGGLWGAIGTAVPFLIGWFLCAPLLHAYDWTSYTTSRSALARVLVTWPFALAVALLIRSVVDHEIPAVPFVLVALLFNLSTLSAWRALVLGLAPAM